MNKVKKVLYALGLPFRLALYAFCWVLGTLLGIVRTDEDYRELKRDLLQK